MSEKITVGTEILRLRDRDPFIPFTIVMMSGDRYRINDPIELIVGHDAMVVVPTTHIAYITLRSNALAAVELVETTPRQSGRNN